MLPAISDHSPSTEPIASVAPGVSLSGHQTTRNRGRAAPLRHDLNEPVGPPRAYGAIVRPARCASWRTGVSMNHPPDTARHPRREGHQNRMLTPEELAQVKPGAAAGPTSSRLWIWSNGKGPRVSLAVAWPSARARRRVDTRRGFDFVIDRIGAMSRERRISLGLQEIARCGEDKYAIRVLLIAAHIRSDGRLMLIDGTCARIRRGHGERRADAGEGSRSPRRALAMFFSL